MIEKIITEVNKKIQKITCINLIEVDEKNTNFFDDILSFKPYQVALIIYACSRKYNIDFYSQVKLDDLCLEKLSEIIYLTAKNKLQN